MNIKEEDLESDQDLKNVIGRVGVGDTGGSNGDGAEDGGEDGESHCLLALSPSVCLPLFLYQFRLLFHSIIC